MQDEFDVAAAYKQMAEDAGIPERKHVEGSKEIWAETTLYELMKVRSLNQAGSRLPEQKAGARIAEPKADELRNLELQLDSMRSAISQQGELVGMQVGTHKALVAEQADQQRQLVEQKQTCEQVLAFLKNALPGKIKEHIQGELGPLRDALKQQLMPECVALAPALEEQSATLNSLQSQVSALFARQDALEPLASERSADSSPVKGAPASPAGGGAASVPEDVATLKASISETRNNIALLAQASVKFNSRLSALEAPAPDARAASSASSQQSEEGRLEIGREQLSLLAEADSLMNTRIAAVEQSIRAINALLEQQNGLLQQDLNVPNTQQLSVLAESVPKTDARLTALEESANGTRKLLDAHVETETKISLLADATSKINTRLFSVEGSIKDIRHLLGGLVDARSASAEAGNTVVDGTACVSARTLTRRSESEPPVGQGAQRQRHFFDQFVDCCVHSPPKLVKASGDLATNSTEALCNLSSLSRGNSVQEKAAPDPLSSSVSSRTRPRPVERGASTGFNSVEGSARSTPNSAARQPLLVRSPPKCRSEFSPQRMPGTDARESQRTSPLESRSGHSSPMPAGSSRSETPLGAARGPLDAREAARSPLAERLAQRPSLSWSPAEGRAVIGRDATKSRSPLRSQPNPSQVNGLDPRRAQEQPAMSAGQTQAPKVILTPGREASAPTVDDPLGASQCPSLGSTQRWGPPSSQTRPPSPQVQQVRTVVPQTYVYPPSTCAPPPLGYAQGSLETQVNAASAAAPSQQQTVAHVLNSSMLRTLRTWSRKDGDGASAAGSGYSGQGKMSPGDTGKA